MIKLIREGKYTLNACENNQLSLLLDSQFKYTWVAENGKLSLSFVTGKDPISSYNLAVSYYRIYQVENEKGLTDSFHLELHAGNGVWQGYLLPSGLPENINLKNEIIPINEVITKTIFQALKNRN